MLLGQIKLNLRRWDALEEEETTFNGLIPFNGPKLTTLTLQAMDSRSVAPRLGMPRIVLEPDTSEQRY